MGRIIRYLPHLTVCRIPATHMSPCLGERIVSSKTSNSARFCGGAAVAESASASAAKMEAKRMVAKAKKGYVSRRSKNCMGVQGAWGGWVGGGVVEALYMRLKGLNIYFNYH
jgi:hypothetical protein